MGALHNALTHLPEVLGCFANLKCKELRGPMNDLNRQQREAIERLRPEDVEAAFKEAKRKGKQAFLLEYGFGGSQKWQVTYEDEAFPTKPIVARAIAPAFGGEVPSAKNFFGGFGETEARATLERLGYRCAATGPRDDQVE